MKTHIPKLMGWDSSKAVPIGKFIPLNSYIKERKEIRN